MSECKEEVFLPHPTLGQHNGEILGKILGYSEQKIEELRKNKVI
jgi:crotonobetainyl-CoA:carnitine CoA-transferase CaiB-like acyl-CoA transferase